MLRIYRRKSNGGGCKSFALGAFFGGVLGGVTALLFAPKSGDKLRKDLAKKYHLASDKAHEVIDGVCDHTSKLYHKAKNVTDNTKTSARKITKRK